MPYPLGENFPKKLQKKAEKVSNAIWGYHFERDSGKLKNRERVRIQTFPVDFCFSESVVKVRAQIGEAIPSLLAKKIDEKTREVLQLVEN